MAVLAALFILVGVTLAYRSAYLEDSDRTEEAKKLWWPYLVIILLGLLFLVIAIDSN